MSAELDKPAHFEVTLHMKGGGRVEFEAEDFTFTNSSDGSAFTKFAWTRIGAPEVEELWSIIPSEVAAVTARQFPDSVA